jgi:L-fuconate dehydratase
VLKAAGGWIMPRITGMDVQDIRFPTSRTLDGSDAMNPAPDYSATYVSLYTADDDLVGHGLTFTIGDGNQLCVAAAQAFEDLVVGRELDAIVDDMAAFWRTLTRRAGLRWVGPEKGVVHLATAAVVNAVWDLWAKREGKPLWRLVADLPPEAIVGLIDFSYISDALAPEEARDLLAANQAGRAERIDHLRANGYPAYTTSAGWIGYDDATIRQALRTGWAAGWRYFKLKVGRDLDEDRRRCALVRETIGWDAGLMLDANQIWDVDVAIAWIQELAEFQPMWVEEPTSPDDILGHQRIRNAVAPIGIATGEMAQNRITFKQLLQAGALDYCQIDACRLGGVNEALAVMLLAAKFDVPVCPHAGGVGLCEYVQHLAMIDHICVSGKLEGRVLEYVDHLHEHFKTPVEVLGGAYVVPEAPGYSITMHETSVRQYRYPDGPAWTGQ